MPTPRPLHRTYCKTCKDFTIHTADFICQICNTKFTSYFPSEVDSDLIEQQRERYKKQRKTEVLGLYGAFMQGNGIETIMKEPKQRVIECDAGQKQIEIIEKQQREEVKRKSQEILDDYNKNYKKLNRNDKCSCGSGKKFKQCHLIYFKKYLYL